MGLDEFGPIRGRCSAFLVISSDWHQNLASFMGAGQTRVGRNADVQASPDFSACKRHSLAVRADVISRPMARCGDVQTGCEVEMLVLAKAVRLLLDERVFLQGSPCGKSFLTFWLQDKHDPLLLCLDRPLPTDALLRRCGCGACCAYVARSKTCLRISPRMSIEGNLQ